MDVGWALLTVESWWAVPTLRPAPASKLNIDILAAEQD